MKNGGIALPTPETAAARVINVPRSAEVIVPISLNPFLATTFFRFLHRYHPRFIHVPYILWLKAMPISYQFKLVKKNINKIVASDVLMGKVGCLFINHVTNWAQLDCLIPKTLEFLDYWRYFPNILGRQSKINTYQKKFF